MAEEPKVEQATEKPELSEESQRAMESAQREGRRAAGVDVKTNPDNAKVTLDPSARGYSQSGGQQGAQAGNGDTSRNAASGLPKYGIDDEEGEEGAEGGSGSSGGKRRRSAKEPYHYDGLYGEMPENTAPAGGGPSYGQYGPGARPSKEKDEGEDKDKEPGTETTDGGAPTGDNESSGGSNLEKEGEKKPEEGAEGEEGKDGKEDKPSENSEESNPDLDNAKAVARDAGMADGDIDKAQKAAEGMADKLDNNPDAEKALEKQLDENEKKQRLEDEEKGGSKKKSPEDKDKEKEKDPEEKAKDEGTDAAAAGMASNPNAMNQGQDPTGNGYKNPTQSSKMDDINRRNLQHNQQVNNARNQGETPKATDALKPKEGAGADAKADGKAKADAKGGDKKGKLKGKAGAAINKAKSAKEFANNPFKWGANKAKNAIVHFLLSHPMLLFAIIFALFFILLIFVLLLGGQLDGGSPTQGYTGVGCSYNGLKGLTTSGSVSLNGIQVELINCDGKEDNYTVLEKIDFEKYVVGVALAEVSWSKSPEYFKAQIVAARGFALKRNSSMCPSHPDNCFYGYNSATNTIRMRACTNDQVYCDPDKPCYHYERSSGPTIYGPEAEKMAGATVWKNQLEESTKSDVMAAAKEVEGKVLVDSSGNVVYTNYVDTDQNQWFEMAQQGMKWDEILIKHYSSSGASNFNSGTCQGTGNIDYGDYSLKSDGDVILNQRLDTFLASQGTSLEAFNALIASNVDKAGYGTRAGVVAAAVTLIGEMGDQYNTKIPYFLSGGHHDGVRSQALGYWGSGYEDDGRRCYYTGYGNVYTVCGLDCSGFVPWAIKTGGFNPGVRLAGNFQYISGARKVSLSSSQAVLEPGDLLESDGHIVLVIGIDDSAKQYICAEASGKSAGVLFTRRPFSGGGGYWGVKMDGYYSNPSNVRSK